MRRSSSRPRREGTACRGGSARLARATYTTPTRVSSTKTVKPAQAPIASAAITIAAKYPTVTRRKRYASASLLKGFITMYSLQDVDGRVDHYPHYVHEVPVDPGDLDAPVRLRREVPSEGSDRREREQG